MKKFVKILFIIILAYNVVGCVTNRRNTTELELKKNSETTEEERYGRYSVPKEMEWTEYVHSDANSVKELWDAYQNGKVSKEYFEEFEYNHRLNVDMSTVRSS